MTSGECDNNEERSFKLLGLLDSPIAKKLCLLQQPAPLDFM